MLDKVISRTITILTGVAAAIAAAILANRFNGDALIYLPFARNTAHLDFFAFNPGVFSSGSTSPLWPLILAPAFWIGEGIVASKVVAYVVLGFALCDTYRTAYRITLSSLASAVTLVIVAFLVVLPGVLMYESALVVIAVNALMRISTRQDDERQSRRDTVARILVWAALPLIRPDAAAMVLLDALILAWKRFRTRGAEGKIIVAAMVVLAAIPATLYYGYSMATLGVPSASGASRSFAFHEGAQFLSGTWYSLETISFLLHPPMIIVMVAAVYGLWLCRSNPILRPVWWLAVLAIPGFLFTVTFIDPVTASPGRYLVLIGPMIALFAGIAVSETWYAATRRSRTHSMLATAITMAAITLTLGMIVRNAMRERAFGHTYNNATDVTLAEYLNTHAPQGSTLLTYDIQVRMRLRDDIRTFDLDGVTDAAIIPYFHDVTGFLQRYRPTYVATNVAVIRPYLANSVIGEVVSHTPDSVGATITRNEMRFTLLQTHDLPDLPEIGTWRRLYAIEYLKGR